MIGYHVFSDISIFKVAVGQMSDQVVQSSVMNIASNKVQFRYMKCFLLVQYQQKR